MGIVVSKQPLDYNAINSSINASSKSTFAEKLDEAIDSASIKNVQYSNTDKGCIYFKAGVNDKNNVVGCVVEINKE